MIRCFLCVFVLLLFVQTVFAESYDVAGGSYQAMREIDAPSGKAVVVTQFLHQGLINLAPKGVDPRKANEGKTVLVTNKTKKPVPFKILQLGPGDFCRIAIQVTDRATGYVIYYGVPGGKTPNNDVKVPEWTSDDGLLFESRWVERAFSMDDLDSLKRAFELCSPIGADYVPEVRHGYNPLTLRREPFMSRYSGTLDVAQAGRYAILTSSHHCSFLLIDGNVVASHPGRHHRSWNAKPELVKQVNLSQGKHKFEYWHTTGDDQTSMLAVWELNSGEKPKFQAIPPEAFQYESIGRVSAGAVSLADAPGVTDFEYKIMGSVPLPDNEQHLIAVQFQNKTAGLAARGKLRWNFGDGQTSDDASPGHIFLKPGTYSVELVSESPNHTFSAVNRIEIDQPHFPVNREKPPTLEQYLPILEKYDATKLDADSLLQLIEAYQAKIDLILNPSEEDLAAQEAAMTEQPQAAEGRARRATPAAKPRQSAQQLKQKQEQVDKYRRLIAETARSALVDNPNFKGDNSIYKMALLAGGIARDYLLDWKLAGQIYVAAAKKLTFDDFAAECYALAADVSLDMMNKTAAKNFLESASKKISRMGVGQPISTFYRVLGEFQAEDGKADQARESLAQAAEKSGTRFQYTEKIALQGSASRSAENFLQEKNYDRAIESLRLWQLEYPAAAYDGYITLLMARYWIGREKYSLAAALADRQLTLNPDSSYIDELLLAAAEAQEKAGNKDAAKAYLNSLIKDYPGSPFVSDAKEKLQKLQ